MDTCQTRESLSQLHDMTVSWSCAKKNPGSIGKLQNIRISYHEIMTWLQGMTPPKHEKRSTGGTCKRKSSWELGEASRCLFANGTIRWLPRRIWFAPQKSSNFLTPPNGNWLDVDHRWKPVREGNQLLPKCQVCKEEQDTAKPHVNQKHWMASSCMLVKGESCCDAMEAWSLKNTAKLCKTAFPLQQIL